MKELLNNLLFMIFPLIFVQVIYSPAYLKKFGKIRNWLVPLLPASSAILCMLFPITINEWVTLDFRSIPIILAGLYGGYPLSLALFPIVMTFQLFIQGSSDFFLVLILNLILFLFIPLFSKKFIQTTLMNKLLVSLSMTFIASILSITISKLHVQYVIDDSLLIQYIVGHLLGMLIVVLLTEMIVQNLFIQQRLLKAEKQEIASRLAASISHEVRNPLTASRGFMQLLYNEVPPSRHKYIDIAIQEMDHVDAIIRDYLTFAKPSIENFDKIKVKEIIQAVIDISKPLASLHSVEITYEIQDEETFVFGDRIKFQQAILNIVKNGIEAMPEGGTLNISVFRKGSTTVIEIHDTGIGMTTEQLNRLGEPYFSTKEKGTGLGMMVSYRIIQTMDGTISVKSEQNKGTSFTLQFPVNKVAS